MLSFVQQFRIGVILLKEKLLNVQDFDRQRADREPEAEDRGE